MSRVRESYSGERLACAACKHQRKKCNEDCILARYFPSAMKEDFQAVHRVFGVKNITKMLTTVEEEDRQRVVDSLVWEARCRQKYPVDGPYGEYERVFNELQIHKHHGAFGVNQNQIQLDASLDHFPWNIRIDGLYDDDQSVYVHKKENVVDYLQRPETTMPMQQRPSDNYYISDGSNGPYGDCK